MCFLTARPPCGVSSLTQLWPRSTWWEPRLTLKSPLLSRLLNQSFCPDRWTWWGKPKDSGFIDKATSKQLAISPSSSLLRENRHFVIPAALNATDTEACPGLCNHSLLFQQHRKNWQNCRLGFPVKWPVDITKLSPQVQHSSDNVLLRNNNFSFISTKTLQPTSDSWSWLQVCRDLNESTQRSTTSHSMATDWYAKISLDYILTTEHFSPSHTAQCCAKPGWLCVIIVLSEVIMQPCGVQNCCGSQPIRTTTQTLSPKLQTPDFFNVSPDRTADGPSTISFGILLFRWPK